MSYRMHFNIFTGFIIIGFAIFRYTYRVFKFTDAGASGVELFMDVQK